MITIKESIRRLTVLKDYLATQVPSNRFDMLIWAVIFQVENQPDYLSTETFSQGGCGTSACALGHAAMIPEFNQLGLRAAIYDSSFCGRNHHYLISYEGADGIHAGANFFGIDTDCSSRIFAPEVPYRNFLGNQSLSGVTIETVINNIDFVLDYQRSKLDEPTSDVIPPYFGAPL